MTDTEKQQNAIVAANMAVRGGLVLRSATELKLAAELFSRSGLVPQWCQNPAQAAYVIEAGQELGFKPVQALQNFQLVNGQLGMRAQAIAGLIRRSGKAAYLKDRFEGEPGTPERCCIVESKRKDDSELKVTTFSLADAKQAGLLGKDNWKHYTDDMLWARAISRHGRRYYSDVTCGFYAAEELADIQPPEEVPTPQAPARHEAQDVAVKDTTDIAREQFDEERFKTLLQRFAELRDLKDGETLREEFLQFVQSTLSAEIQFAEWKDLLLLQSDDFDLLERELDQEEIDQDLSGDEPPPPPPPPENVYEGEENPEAEEQATARAKELFG